ncbi:MAG: glycoside hydrolase family 65 protein, partial [Ruthenibacterium sp.]
MTENPKVLYPIEPWSVTETGFCIENNYRNETVFALSNGYLGTRGTWEEAYDFDVTQGMEGNFINGFYESEPIRYGECCYGFPANSQTLLNLPNAKGILLRLPNGEVFSMQTGSMSHYRRTLHLDRGLVTRTLEWTSPQGLRIRLLTERLVSFSDKRLMAIHYTVCPLNFSGTLTLTCLLDGDVCNHTRVTNPLIDYGPYERSLLIEQLTADESGLFLLGRTKHSGLSMACMTRSVIDAPSAVIYSTDGLCACAKYTVNAVEGVSVRLTKYIAYVSFPDITV